MRKEICRNFEKSDYYLIRWYNRFKHRLKFVEEELKHMASLKKDKSLKN